MACVHEFGVIDSLKDYAEDQYEPEKYHCISLEDDFLAMIYEGELKEKIERLETYAHHPQRPYQGLCYYGITLIPPKSLAAFLEIIQGAYEVYQIPDLERLIDKINSAIQGNKWMIHYGI